VRPSVISSTGSFTPVYIFHDGLILASGDADSVPAAKKRSRPKLALSTDPSSYAPRADRSWKVGAHVSAAGGVENAILNAAAIGYAATSTLWHPFRLG
jgi:hypothetical protein